MAVWYCRTHTTTVASTSAGSELKKSIVMKFNIFHHQHGDSPHPAAAKPQDVISRSKEGSAATPIKSADSDAIMNKVDIAYKQFNEFHINLKHLLKLYKEEHYALKTVNEKRFEVRGFCSYAIESSFVPI